jgi:hypothetical protein
MRRFIEDRVRQRVGWGGWTRTNTVLINSEVPYRLDHAPTLGHNTIRLKHLMEVSRSTLDLLNCVGFNSGVFATMSADELLHMREVNKWLPLTKYIVRQMLKNELPPQFLRHRKDDGTIVA